MYAEDFVLRKALVTLVMKDPILIFLVNLLIIAENLAYEDTTYTPKNICIRLTTNNTALLQWVEPVTLRSEIVGYKIYYTKDADLPLHEWNSQTIGSNPLTTIKNIELGQIYTFRIQVTSFGLEGPGPLSDFYNFRMLNRTRSCYDQPKSKQIKTLNVLRAAATSYNSVEVWWNFMYDPHHVIGFQIFYERNGSLYWANKTVGLTQSAELTNLEEGDTYKIALAAVTHSGLEHYSQETTVKVQPEEVPIDVKIFDITSHSIILNWLPPPRLHPIKYKISYDAVKDFVDSNGIRQHYRYERVEEIVNGHLRSYALLNLKPYTNYNINISAIPVDYSYRPSARVNARTEMAAPGPMSKPDLYGIINGGNVQLLLPQASEEYGPISFYYVIVVPKTDADIELPSSIYSTEDLLETEWQEGEDIDSPYIAAKFSAKIPYAFILGAGDQGGFKNHKLDSHKQYRVFVRAVVMTPQGDLFTDSPFSDYISLTNNKVKPKSKSFSGN